ncbi:hypothetical protein [Blastococcus capsensis]|uniref:hypothetical protein n=1 Tax=Blastococcus capsensis TaxID=1564163 RepID=UPI00253FA0D4|nr:hypothetical protein [Blastococcus capsensis]MDK3258782.1 hypothetical protein [Blastococcus capsensis]
MVSRPLSGIVLAATLTFGLVACGGEEVAEPDVAAPVETDPADIDPDAPETDAGDTGAATSPTESPTASPTETGGAAGAAGEPIEIIETSYDIALAEMAGDEEPLTVMVPSPGTYTFRVTNDSDIVHSLEVEGNGVEAVTGDIAPGATATLEVMLPTAGEYDLYCPIGNHKELGMDGSVQVGG